MEYKLQNLIEVSLFQAMLDHLNELYPFPSSIIDLDGNILASSACVDICSRFYCEHYQPLTNIKNSKYFYCSHFAGEKTNKKFRCPHGLHNCFFPIIIEGNHLGNLNAGLVFIEKPDLDFFKQNALKYDFNLNEYLEAIEKIPVWTPDELNKYLNAIRSLLNIMIKIGSGKLKEFENLNAIQEKENRFRELFNNAPDAILLAEIESGIIIDANKSASQLLGRSVPELIGLHQSELHPVRLEQYTRESFKKHANGAAGTDEAIVVENVIIRKDGSEIPVEILASTIGYNGKNMLQGVFRDISGRKKSEKELLHSEKKYRALAENLPDSIARFDKNLRYTYVNPAIEKITGIPAFLFLGKKNEDLPLLAEYFIQWNKNIRWVFEHLKQRTFEFTFVSNQLVRYFSTLLVPEFDQNGEVSTVLLVSRDITGLKKSENMLKVQHQISLILGKSNDLSLCLNQVLDSVCQLEGIDCGKIYLVDPSTGGLNLIVNRGLSDEFINQNSFFSPESEMAAIIKHRIPVYSSYTEILEQNNPVIIQEKLRSTSIIPILYNGMVMALFNLSSHHNDEIPQDTRIALELIASNIGATILRIEMENQLKESEEKYALAFRTSPDAININTLDGVYIDISDGFTELTGYTKEESIGVSSLKLNLWANPEDREKLVDAIKKEGKIENLEALFRVKDGSLITGLMSANLIRINKIPHILSITRDITSRKKIETELILAKEKAEESDRLKTSFLANISHEMRTPMNGILGFAELLNDDTLSPEVRQEYNSVIYDSGMSLLDVITNIVDLSKIDSRQIDSKFRPFNLNALIDETLKWLKSEKITREKSNLEVEVQLGLPDEDPVIHSDPGKIRHIFRLLLNNATKFTHHGTIRFGYLIQDEKIRFFVQDTGKGISAEKQDFIFERFRQEDETMSRKYGGLGLGLTIAKGIVELLKGSIQVESELGKGSTFWFEIPMN